MSPVVSETAVDQLDDFADALSDIVDYLEAREVIRSEIPKFPNIFNQISNWGIFVDEFEPFTNSVTNDTTLKIERERKIAEIELLKDISRFRR